jgi:hypothetical protein
MLPSEDVLKHWELLISIISGILTLASGFVKIRFLRYVFGAIFFFSLGFYLSFLHYERNWVLTDNVRGRLYDFKDKQSCVPESPQHPSVFSTFSGSCCSGYIGSRQSQAISATPWNSPAHQSRKGWLDTIFCFRSKKGGSEEQYAERRRREDRIERLWNRMTLFETTQ